MLRDDSVSASGFVMNQWGVGGSVTRGPWSFEGEIPSPPTVTEEVEFPVEVSLGSSFGHRTLFETGVAEMSGAEADKLREFVQGLP